MKLAMASVRCILMTLALVLGLSPVLADTGPGPGPHILVALVPQSDAPAFGQRTTLALSMTPQPGWHGYWKATGDAGLPTKIAWTLPKGVVAGEPAYPVPDTLVIAGLMNHVYEKPYALLVPLDVPAGLAKGAKLPIAAKIDYLVCSPSICVPETANVSTTLTVGDGATDTTTTARFDAWRKALPRPLGSPAHFEVKDGLFRLAVPLPASVTLDAPHLFAETDGALLYAADQRFSRDGDMLIVETKAGTGTPKSFDGVLKIGADKGLSLSATPGAVPAAGDGAAPGKRSQAALILIALIGAVLGGLILNVMPCVFPILSLKALSLARGGGEEKQVRREALAYAGGVIAVCVALGGLILGLRAGGTSVGWAFQLQDPRVILVLLLLTSAIGFNLAGLFELGAVTAGSELADKGGTAGAFWTGALAAFVATPCTGPFMAGALGAALVLPTIAALLIFAGLGLGLALPFLLIGYVPALRRVLPKPGAWMERFRHILAVPMFLTALGLAWVLGRQTAADGVVLGVGAAMLFAIGLWITGRRQHAYKRLVWLPALVMLVVALGALALLPAKSAPITTATGTIASVPFDEAKLATLRAQNKPVLLYFTADWCLTCKVNEKTAIERAETQAAFTAAGVTTMIGDWTDGDAAIGKFLEAHGRSGVPLYLWYAPGREPKELPQILTPGLLVGLASAPNT
jgi:thiol:disulfide interchange protein